MVFEHIENLKRIYTDQLVVVDDNRAELGRFQGLTGTVKTVNMSGRALAEFDANNNIGWYDIDVDFLKLVDEPVHETETVSTPVPPAEPAAPAAEASAQRRHLPRQLLQQGGSIQDECRRYAGRCSASAAGGGSCGTS